MIGEALNYIRIELRDHLSVQDTEISLGQLHTLGEGRANKEIRLALVNVTEEVPLQDRPQYVGSRSGTMNHADAPAPLNLQLLIAFDFGDYRTSLTLLSKALDLFHAKPVFEQATQRLANPVPSGLQRLIFAYCNCDLEQLSRLWGVMGGVHFPSLLYQVRVVRRHA